VDETTWALASLTLILGLAVLVGLAARWGERRRSRTAGSSSPPIRPTPVGQNESHKRTETGDSDPAQGTAPPRRWRPGALARRWLLADRKRDREGETVEVSVLFDSPTDLFVLRRCDACGRNGWLFGPRVGARRVACRTCLYSLRGETGKAPGPTEGPRQSPSSDQGGGGSTPPTGTTPKKAPPPGRPEPPGPPPPATARVAQAKRAEQIRAWNDDHEARVEEDVTETLGLAIPRRPGEADAEYRGRLNATAEEWASERSSRLFATRGRAAPPGAVRSESPRSARKGGRKKS
jgi:hypothetical protein